MNADDFRDYMLSFLFLRYLSDNYESAAMKELGKDYPKLANEEATEGATTPLEIWYEENLTQKWRALRRFWRNLHRTA